MFDVISLPRHLGALGVFPCGPPGVYTLLIACAQVLSAVAYMHRRGFFHRDLKPDNLLMTEAGHEPAVHCNRHSKTCFVRAGVCFTEGSVLGTFLRCWSCDGGWR